MIDSNLLDSSIWVDYFVNGKNVELIENEKQVFISVISIIEVKNKLAKLKIPEFEISKKIKFLEERSTPLFVTLETAKMAADIVIEKGIHTSDAIIYASALINKSKLITLDNDFRGLEGVEVLD